jgi:hypothetical protein
MPGRMNTKKTKEKNSFKRKERSLLKKCLTGPTLLEISGNRVNRPGAAILHYEGNHVAGDWPTDYDDAHARNHRPLSYPAQDR